MNQKTKNGKEANHNDSLLLKAPIQLKLSLNFKNQFIMKKFIQENRPLIDQIIAKRLGQPKNPYPNDAERRLWVLNDEYLYNMYQYETRRKGK